MKRFFTVALLVFAAACSRMEQLPQGKGLLQLKLGTDMEVTPAVKSQAGAPDPCFSLEIKPPGGGESIIVDDCRQLSSEPLSLNAGRYTLKAFSGPAEPNAWNRPSYAGEIEFLLKPEIVNEAFIPVSLSSTMVTSSLDEKTLAAFPEYRLKVKGDGGEALCFDSISLNDTAYFRSGSLQWELELKNSKGETFRMGPKQISPVRPREHYRLSFALEEYRENPGGAIVRIRVDDSMVEKTYQLYLDFGDDNFPALTASFDVTDVIDVPKGSSEPYTVYANAHYGIKNLVISHNSEDLLQTGLKFHTELVDAGNLDALNASGVTAAPVSFGEQSASINFNKLFNRLNLGSYPITITLVDSKDHFAQFTFNFKLTSGVEAEARKVTPWACFAIVEGCWFTGARPQGLKLQYRKASESAWTDHEGPLAQVGDDGSFTSEIYGLEASTAYQFRVITDKDKDTKVIDFTTAASQTIPNLNFDDWYQSGSAWYPGKNSSSRVWDTANGGTASYGCVPTTPESTDVVSGKAARLESTTVTVAVITKFAAGNIYVGDFVKVSGVGAEIDWGTPFSARPVALHGYYKYLPKAIDYAESPYTDKKGQTDNCSIKMYLLDWSGKFRINTSKKVFLQDDDPSIIAMCDFTTNQKSNNYIEFTLPLHYRDSRTPKYVVVVGAASRLGDYFTGGKGSTLLLDEFSFIFDAGALSEEQRASVGYRDLL